MKRQIQELNKQLLEAVQKKDFEKVVDLHIKGADANAQNQDDETSALMYAAYLGDERTTRGLIEWGADVNACNKIKNTALILGCHHTGTLEVSQMLIDNGADMNARNDSDFTPLLTCVFCGHFKMATLLILNGATVEVTRNGRSLLDFADSTGLKKLSSLIKSAQNHPDWYHPIHKRAFENQVKQLGAPEVLNLPYQNKELLERLYLTSALFQGAFDKLSYSEQKLFYTQTYKGIDKQICSLMEQQLRERSRQQG